MILRRLESLPIAAKIVRNSAVLGIRIFVESEFEELDERLIVTKTTVRFFDHLVCPFIWTERRKTIRNYYYELGAWDSFWVGAILGTGSLLLQVLTPLPESISSAWAIDILTGGMRAGTWMSWQVEILVGSTNYITRHWPSDGKMSQRAICHRMIKPSSAGLSKTHSDG